MRLKPAAEAEVGDKSAEVAWQPALVQKGEERNGASPNTMNPHVATASGCAAEFGDPFENLRVESERRRFLFQLAPTRSPRPRAHFVLA